MPKLLLALLVLILSGACGIRPETDDRRIVHSGDVAIIVHANWPEVPVSLAKRDAHELARAVEGGDQAMLRRMIDTGKAAYVPAHVRVRVIAESYNERCVQVIEGPHAGRKGWVPFEWLRFQRI